MSSMPLSNLELWNRIEEFPLDKEQALPFSRRLAEENNWSRDFAKSVIKEYKKFVYLACVSETPASPSDEVDQAWHLHLCDTKDYWEVFCKETLRRDFHHSPTKGGQEERERHQAQYGQTKAIYRAEFDEEPSEDIWPAPEIRFSKKGLMKRVDVHEYSSVDGAMYALAVFVVAAFGLGYAAGWSKLRVSRVPSKAVETSSFCYNYGLALREADLANPTFVAMDAIHECKSFLRSLQLDRRQNSFLEAAEPDAAGSGAASDVSFGGSLFLSFWDIAEIQDDKAPHVREALPRLEEASLFMLIFLFFLFFLYFPSLAAVNLILRLTRGAAQAREKKKPVEPSDCGGCC
jgi:hypothetical protein